jgi:crotonobetainyl-CoA:carnitine CoA-transferase CaiB-like acyl-CoA transferase
LKPTDSLLKGIRVLDFGWVWAGPLVTSALADLGAEVIKIEHAARLDNARLRGRAAAWADLPYPSIELVPYFHTLNRGKKSVTINLKDERGVSLIKSLVAVSDVLVENLSRGALARAGLGYEDLRTVNERLVYLSISAAGEDGPLSDMRAYAPVTSSFAGLENLIGYPGERPTGMMTYGIADGNAGSHALVAVLAGLVAQRRTGKGVFIDVSQLESLLATMAEPILEYTITKTEPEVPGSRRRDMAPRGVYPASGVDRWLSIAVTDDRAWSGLIRATGVMDWETDPSLASLGNRLRRHDELDHRLVAWTSTLDRDEAVKLLREEGVAASPVLSLDEALAHPYFRARGISQLVDHPLAGPEQVFTLPWKLSQTPARIAGPAPLLGQHNRQVLMDLIGLSDVEFDDLRREGVIA